MGWYHENSAQLLFPLNSQPIFCAFAFIAFWVLWRHFLPRNALFPCFYLPPVLFNVFVYRRPSRMTHKERQFWYATKSKAKDETCLYMESKWCWYLQELTLKHWRKLVNITFFLCFCFICMTVSQRVSQGTVSTSCFLLEKVSPFYLSTVSRFI